MGNKIIENIISDPQEKEVKIKVNAKSDDEVGMMYTKENKKSKNIRSFSDFYQSTSNSRSELSKIEKQDPNRKKKTIAFIIISLVIILGVSVAGFLYFISQEDRFGSDSIDFEVIKPSLISSGDNVNFTITIHNRENVDILGTEFIVQYPEDFIFNSSDPVPKNEANNVWSLGVIKAGDSKSLNITGQIFGKINSAKNFKTTLNYMPENFSSEFQKSDSFDLEINDSVYDLIMTVPSKVVNGFSSQYSIKIINTSEEDSENLKLNITIPENLSVSSFNPEPDSGDNSWDVGALKSGEAFEVVYNAILEGAEGDMAEIKADVGYVGSNNEYLIQEEKSAIVFVVNPQMVLDLTINDSQTGYPVNMGDNLKYKISYQNNSQSEIRDLKITATLVGELLDWDTMADNNDGIIEDNTISWNQDQIESLSSIKTGEAGEILFNINLHDIYNFSSDEEINKVILSSVVALSDNVVDLEGGTLEVVSNNVENKLNSKLDLRAEGRYYDDEYIKIGDGPLPPEVGQTTKYKVYWFLQNGSNEVSDVTISATLPDYVVWDDSTNVNAGSISYNPTNRQVSWTINKIPEHVGKFLTELQASFEIAITPVSTDLGQVMILLNKSQITAQDSFTEEEIKINKDLISTTLENDPLYVGDGLVVRNTSTNINSNTNLNTNTNNNLNSNIE